MPYHKSLVDWLLDFDRAGDDFYVSVKEAHGALVGKLLRVVGSAGGSGGVGELTMLTKLCDMDVRAPGTPLPLPVADYAIDFLPDHLTAAGMGGAATDVLCSLPWLQAALKHRGLPVVMSALHRRLAVTTANKEPRDTRDLKLLIQLFGLVAGAAKEGNCAWPAELCTQLTMRCEDLAFKEGGRLAGLVDAAKQWLSRHGGWVVERGPWLQRVTKPGGACEAVLQGHTAYVSAVLQLSDGRLASGSQDGTVRVTHVDTGQCDLTIAVGGGIVNALAELPGKRLVTGTSDGKVRIWAISLVATKQSVCLCSRDTLTV